MDGTDEVRTFAALPPARGRGFAQTWWGQAWLKALEDTALDNEQLKRGRRAAREGAVGAVSVQAGRITAVVHDRDRTAHRSDVLLTRLSDAEWDRLLTMAVERSGHIAALLDREMPPHLVEDAAGAGVELLPGIGDLEPRCDCGSWDHCMHTTALCYQVARLLDQDPFVLMLMRGRPERLFLDELQARGSAAAEPAEEPPAGVPAAEAYADGGILPPLPALPELTDAPGRPPSLDTGAEPPAGVDVTALEFLAADAAARAHVLLAEALRDGHEQQPMVGELTPQEDAVRMAAASPDASVVGRLAAGSARTRDGLVRAVRAWTYGGAAGLRVLEEEWTPDGESLVRAAASLDAAWEDGERPHLVAAGNRWTAGDGQLRYGRDGRWWPYRQESGHWVPAGGGGTDPAAVLAGLDEAE
ncbi:SWF or SNF family helicase [Streptomyces sp. NPDC060194]|uniref:SWIM zinc finger family protein n=1 Tax=Streptomyces sp. NPDC060194 TaxID=3347069 RepID=UPI0036677850